MMSFTSVSVLGVRVDRISLNDLMKYIVSTIQTGHRAAIVYVNAHAINMAYHLEWFKTFLNQSEVVFCDGFGVKWAARFLHGQDLYRYTPPDWFGHLASICVEHDFSLFLLGTRQEIIEKAAAVLRHDYPEIRIVGIMNGFFDKSAQSPENQQVLTCINSAQPDILVVGFGMPAQEQWIQDNWPQIRASVVIPVGAFFDYFVDAVPRAPHWMTDHGLEWFGRVLIEPSRLWKRYLIGNPLFLYRILMQRLGFIKF
jgi:N-acetylglucosaminyldiphosphoundecaprenol N-acetyl-beta-D-mannosaminyltransferase